MISIYSKYGLTTTLNKSVNDIKKDIFSKWGILPENQVISQNKIILEDDKNIDDYPEVIKPVVALFVNDKTNPIFLK